MATNAEKCTVYGASIERGAGCHQAVDGVHRSGDALLLISLRFPFLSQAWSRELPH